MIIQKIQNEDFSDWLEMGLMLWPKHSKAELKKEFEEILKSKKEETFLCKDEDGSYIGFINVSLRFEYIPGATSSPVGYVEGIFIKEQYRKKGIAKKLIDAGEEWVKSKGCKEMGSDTELHNKTSQAFHKKLGFKEDDILVHFIKKI
ncbi:GNAT family N-acetyltransferase [Candidatus Woesearchaeota archaeon]|nr:GNAT family N-acetyltransferase [Candidatus Woesearchaeota archaeon]